MIEVLPTCVHRGSVNTEGRYPCDNDVQLVLPANGVPLGTCMVCPYAKDAIPEGFWERRRGRIGIQVPVEVPKRGLCLHLGKATGEVAACGTCPGSTRLKVFACSIHGRCTVERKIPFIAGCNANTAGLGCQDYKEAPDAMAQ